MTENARNGDQAQSYHVEQHVAVLKDGEQIFPRDGFTFTRTPRKIFFIGFNKSATSSLFILMHFSGIRSIHSSGNGKLFGRTHLEQTRIPHATQWMYYNIANGRPPLTGLDDYDAFMDLTVGPVDLCLSFEKFYAAYPDALFVLNTRPLDAWMKSRRKRKIYLRMAREHFKITRPQVIEKWRSDFIEHHKRVRAFFAENAPEQFLEWQISSSPTLLADFFGRFDIAINPDYYLKIRETGRDFFPENIRLVKSRSLLPIK